MARQHPWCPMTEHQPEQASDILVVDMTIVLAGINPLNLLVLTPDYLKEMGIIGDDLTVDPDPQKTYVGYPATQVTFQEGVIVTFGPNRIVVKQTGEGDITVPTIARRIVEQVHGQYVAIGINPRIFRTVSLEREVSISRMLRGDGAWLKHDDTDPHSVNILVRYVNDERAMVLDVSRVRATPLDGSPDKHGLMFTINIHRDLTGSANADRRDHLLKILDGWETDVSDAAKASALFLPLARRS